VSATTIGSAGGQGRHDIDPSSRTGDNYRSKVTDIADGHIGNRAAQAKELCQTA
jgi:hypothetical protein